MILSEYQAVYSMMPEVDYDNEHDVWHYQIEAFSAKEMFNPSVLIKYSLTIHEADEYVYGTPEYEYWEKHNGDVPTTELQIPKIHVWEFRKCFVAVDEEEDIIYLVHKKAKGLQEIPPFKHIEIQFFDSEEVYHGEAIVYPSEKYDELFEKLINEHFDELAPIILNKMKIR